jgi:hypothetical protein
MNFSVCTRPGDATLRGLVEELLDDELAQRAQGEGMTELVLTPLARTAIVETVSRTLYRLQWSLTDGGWNESPR